MVICFYRQQLEVFMQQEWFQCDMAFKRLKNKNEKEIIFAMMNKINRKRRFCFLSKTGNRLLTCHSLHFNSGLRKPRVDRNVLPDVSKGIFFD